MKKRLQLGQIKILITFASRTIFVLLLDFLSQKYVVSLLGRYFYKL